MKKLLFLFVLILFAHFAFGQSDIHSIDFKNFTYYPHCAGEETQAITVTNGEFLQEKKMRDYVDRLYFNIFAVTYGDLNGDQKDEAVVLSFCNTGGTGNFSEGFIYTLRNGKPILLTRISGGDRAYGGLRKAVISNGILTVERNDPGENGANCCPEFIETQKYQLANGKLLEIGKPMKRPMFPTERVTFEGGTNGKTITITVPSYEGKRFVVGARAAQRLTVSGGKTEAMIRLLEEARITEGVNNFLAVLPKTGDYTIEVSNQTDREITVTINIKIQ